jgi:anti-sigma B factor antagonist
LTSTAGRAIFVGLGKHKEGCKMSLKISVRDFGTVCILDLSGRITLGEAAGMLRDSIKDLLAKGCKNLLLNLAEVTYIDSSGLGELVGAFATVSNRGGRLKLLNMQERVNELMQITKLYSVFESFTDEAEAVRSFAPRAAAV